MRSAVGDLDKELCVVFFGSGLFALPILARLLSGGEGYRLAGVVTQPPRRSGRGQRVRSTPVESLVCSRASEVARQGGSVALLHNTRADFLDTLRALQADIFLTACYAEKLSSALLSLPRLGSFNLHASLLPRWRGSAPVARSILAGDEETGVTVIRMNETIDGGEIVRQARTRLGSEETSSALEGRLAEIAADEGIKFLDLLVRSGKAEVGRKQEESFSCRAVKLRREESFLDWEQSASFLSRHVRALQPWPGSIFSFGGIRIKVFSARAVEGSGFSGRVGEVLSLSPELHVCCGAGGGEALSLLRLQRAGGDICSAAAFLRGFSIPLGSVLSGG